MRPDRLRSDCHRREMPPVRDAGWLYNVSRDIYSIAHSALFSSCQDLVDGSYTSSAKAIAY